MSMEDDSFTRPRASKPKHGLARWGLAFKNCLNGFKYGWRSEAAIREEVVVFFISVALAPFIADSPGQCLLLVLSVLFVLIVEILNSALEAALDRVSTEFHPLTGAAKDLGSLAVLLAIVLASSFWLYAILF